MKARQNEGRKRREDRKERSGRIKVQISKAETSQIDVLLSLFSLSLFLSSQPLFSSFII